MYFEMFSYLNSYFSTGKSYAMICVFEEIVYFDLWILDSGFRIPDSRFHILDSGFRILVSDSGFRFRFPGFRIAPCCVRLAPVLRDVGCSWLKLENRQIWANNTQHVATRWPNARNMLRPTMLRYVALACCDRLAGVLEWSWRMVPIPYFKHCTAKHSLTQLI